MREYVQTAEELGYHHIIVYDHVLGADTRHYKGWDGFYSYEDMFHEAFVVFGYMAGITSRIELVTSVIILVSARPPWSPSRQLRWTYSPAAGSGSVSARAGTPSSTRPWERTSTTAADGARSRSSL